VATLERRGYKPERMRSSRIAAEHFVDFDWVLAMDTANMTALTKVCPAEHTHKLRLLLSYAPDTGRAEVPDPYYGNAQGFELVLDLCEAAVNGLLMHYT
jgi:protein-tyrosine phosphatase